LDDPNCAVGRGGQRAKDTVDTRWVNQQKGITIARLPRFPILSKRERGKIKDEKEVRKEFQRPDNESFIGK